MFSPAVPSPCHSEHIATGLPRSTTDTHGPLTCGGLITGARHHEWQGRSHSANRWGHGGATSGPRTTGSQRTPPVNTGLPSAEVTEHTPLPAAGRRDPPEISDTEPYRVDVAVSDGIMGSTGGSPGTARPSSQNSWAGSLNGVVAVDSHLRSGLDDTRPRPDRHAGSAHNVPDGARTPRHRRPGPWYAGPARR